MFDRTVVNSSPSSIHSTVHEHRAPTDDSIRLYDEMRKKAEDAIIASVRVKDTHFEGVIHHYRDFANARLQFRVIYSLNGKKMTTNYDHSERDYSESAEDIYLKIVDAVARDIANEILAKPFAESAKAWVK